MDEINEENNNSLTLEEENALKESIKFLQEVYKIKSEKLKILKQESSEMKKLFKSKISEYENDIKLIIEKETEKEQLFSKISKMNKRRALILKNYFNDKLYQHLLEISTNAKKEKILKNFFSLILFDNNINNRNIHDIIQALRDKEEIKNLLIYAYKIYNNMRKEDENIYLEYKKKYDMYNLELKSLDNSYPFDELFECLGIIFDIIHHEKLIQEKNLDLNKLTEKKNSNFIEIKFIELKIKNYKKIIKTIRNHIKIIFEFYNNFNEYKVNNDKKYYQELLLNIEKYKKMDFDYNNMNSNYDSISSLTLGTYFSQSEESSDKSNFDFKQKNKLANSKINGNEETKSKFNIKNNIREIANNILEENNMKNKLSKNLNNVKNEPKLNNLNLNMPNKDINNEKNKTKINNNLPNLQKFGLEINEMKNKYHEESIDMENTKELITRNNIDNYNNEDSSDNDSSVCDEMILSNYESNNFGRFTRNNYINRIGTRNNVVLSQELYKNKLFMRENNQHNIKIEKSVDDTSTCCVSCT